MGVRAVVDRAAAGRRRWTSSPTRSSTSPAAVDAGRRRPVRSAPSAATDEPFGNAREPIAQVFTPIGGGDAVPVRGEPLQVQGLRRPAGPATSTPATARAPRTSPACAGHRAARLGPDDPGRADAVCAGRRLQLVRARRTRCRCSTTPATPMPSSARRSDKSSYSFSGLSGSLDHILINPAPCDRATGADIWNINSAESIALRVQPVQLPRHLVLRRTPYASSDHDPVVLGLTTGYHLGRPEVQILGHQRLPRPHPDPTASRPAPPSWPVRSKQLRARSTRTRCSPPPAT